MSWLRGLRNGSDLVAATTANGEELIGRRDALVVPGRELPWESILSADWDSDSDTLTVVLVDPEVLTFKLDQPGAFLPFVRERVTASVVLVRRFPVEGEGGFSVMARRPPAGGEIRFDFEYDRGLDPDDLAVREAARAALAAVRAELGL